MDYVVDIEPTGHAGKRGEFWRASLGGEELVTSAVNVELDACRVMRDRGLSGRVGFRHADGMIGLITSVAWGAKRTVSEGSGSPRFVKWKEFTGIGPETDDVVA